MNLKRLIERLLTVFTTVGIVASASAQGTVFFTTINTGIGLNAKVYLNGSPLAGNSYLAQLYAAQGVDAPLSALQPGKPVTTFRSGGAAGYVNAVLVTFDHIPPDIAGYTIQMRVWDNHSGLYPDWEAAQSAWCAGKLVAGFSPRLSYSGNIGGQVTSPPYLTGLQSFTLMPEPSAMLLVEVSTGVLLILRRWKPRGVPWN